MGGALLISLLLVKVMGSQHCGPQLRQLDKIGPGTRIHGRARRAGPDKGGDRDAASHNSEVHKSPATAQ